MDVLSAIKLFLARSHLCPSSFSQMSRFELPVGKGPNNVNVFVGITGSVAAIKRNALLDAIKLTFERKGMSASIVVAITQKAQHFRPDSEIGLAKDVKIYVDEDEWEWRERGDPVLHIDLATWADIGLIAPLDACTTAKLATGLCDNLLTCVCIAWQHSLRKPLILCPSMNTHMYENPVVQANLKRLQGLNMKIIRPIEKKLVCGTTGMGAMQEVNVIAEELANLAKDPSKCFDEDVVDKIKLFTSVGLVGVALVLFIRNIKD